MKAHPTKYAGVQFRSRLEARWAAFFDLAGWQWEYEPVDDEGWVPDFFLTRSELPVEVKPIEWRNVNWPHYEHLFDVLRECEDLEKVRRSPRLEALILGAYPLPMRRRPGIGVFHSKLVDRDPFELAFLFKGKKGHVFDLMSGFDECYLWFGSGEPMFRNEREWTSNEEMAAVWREAGNRVQWKGAGATT